MAKTVHYLSEPLQFEGETYTKLEMDFDRLRGKDIKEVQRVCARPDKVTPIMAFDQEFGAYVAAKAAKIPYEMLDELMAGDYVAIAQEATNFLIASGFSKEDQSQLQEVRAKRLPKS